MRYLKKYESYVKSFDFEVGERYSYDELPPQTQYEIDIQLDLVNESPYDYKYEFKMLKPEEYEEYIVNHFGEYNIGDVLEDEDVIKLRKDIADNGLIFPSVGLEGNHRALIHWDMGKDLPYLQFITKDIANPKSSMMLEWNTIGHGTEGEVYTDNEFAYKVVPSDLVSKPQEIKNTWVGEEFKNVVNTYDAWSDDDKTVIKMELLEELPKEVTDNSEYDRVYRELWNANNNPDIIDNISSSNKEVQKMLDSIKSAGEEIKKVTGAKYLDVGFHNLMYDPKTDEYKQIDIH